MNIKRLYKIKGLRCASCKIFLEETLSNQDYIKSVNVNFNNKTIMIEFDAEKSDDDLLFLINEKIKTSGYELFVDTKELKDLIVSNQDGTIWKALPIGIIFLGLFFFLQKSGILNFGLGSTVTPITSFIIGLIASVSSCLAVVGGLVLSLSAKVSQDNVSDKKNFTLFHVGRLLSFALLGGMLGLIGEVLGINFIFSAILGIIASLVMLVLGLNLIGIFQKSNITLPSGIFSFFRKIEHSTLTPLIIGFATFFLPCGFTQSMQVVALSSGSFLSGSLTMLMFALGTLPVLLLLSFGSSTFSHSKYAPLFFKSAGIVVIGLGLFALLAGLAGLGIINPLFNI